MIENGNNICCFRNTFLWDRASSTGFSYSDNKE
jgi:hypothetical protein